MPDARTSARKKRAEYGLYPRAFKASRRWAVDNVDPAFLRTLKPEERAFLERFNREYYDADFRGGSPLHATQELKRACYGAQNSAHRDVFSRGLVTLEDDVPNGQESS